MTVGLRLGWEDLEDLFLHAPCGYIVCDLDGLLLRVNETFLKMTGYRMEELVGRKRFSDLLTLPCKIFYDTHFAPLLRMQGRADEVALDITRASPAPSLPVLINATSRRLGQGSGHIVKMAIFTARDRRSYERDMLATQRKAEASAEQERIAREAAEQAGRAKDEFLALISHELRTPLQSILGWAQILRRRATSMPEIEQGLFAIQQSARIQAGLINDLLDTGRIISGKMRLDVQHVELSSVMEAAIETSRPAAEAKEIKLLKVIDSALHVLGDPGRLQQVFWNLISNAIKFTPSGGYVQIGITKVGSHAEATVEDNGRGMSDDTIRHAFERFRQGVSESTRRTDGLGLGLSLVKHLVEMHGGHVKAESEGEGRGSRFTVRLPLATLEKQEKNHSYCVEEDLPDVRLDGLRVAVVDDSDEIRVGIVEVLETAGAVVLALSSGAEAINQVEEYQPDLIISDLAMPGMDGYEFIRRVRMLGAGINCVPAIALTALTRVEYRTRALLAGYHLHLPKPLDPRELLAAVSSLTSTHS